MSENIKTILAIFIMLTLSRILYYPVREFFHHFLPEQHFHYVGYAYKILEVLAAALIIRLFGLTQSRKKIEGIKVAKIAILLSCSVLGLWLTASALEFGLKLAFSSPATATAIEKIQSSTHEVNGYFALFLTVLIGPLSEELLFRFFGIQQLRKTFSLNLSILVPALIFALFHYSGGSFSDFMLINFIPFAVTGFILGMIFVRYGLISSLFVHGAFNFVMRFKEALADYPLTAMLLCLTGVTAVVSILIKHFRGKEA